MPLVARLEQRAALAPQRAGGRRGSPAGDRAARQVVDARIGRWRRGADGSGPAGSNAPCCEADPSASPSRSGRGLSELEDDEALLGQLAHRVGRAFAGVAGVLDAAVRHLVGAEGRRLVDGHAAELELAARRAARAADVGGEDPRLEAEAGRVRELDRLVERVDGGDRADRARRPRRRTPGVAGRVARSRSGGSGPRRSCRRRSGPRRPTRAIHSRMRVARVLVDHAGRRRCPRRRDRRRRAPRPSAGSAPGTRRSTSRRT